MDMTRTSGWPPQPDIRFRPSFTGWKARLCIEYADTVAVQTVIDALHRAGSVGVGEWRPEKSGVFGTFAVTRNIDDRKEHAEVDRECMSPLVPLRIPEWAMDAEIDTELFKKIMGSQTTKESEDSDSDEIVEESQATDAVVTRRKRA
jgi:hypothetical protein